MFQCIWLMTDRHANKYLWDKDMQPIINATDVIWDKQLIYFKSKIPINSRFKQIFFQHAIQYIMPDDIWHSSIWAIRMYVMEILVKILVIFDLHTIMNWSGLNIWNTQIMKQHGTHSSSSNNNSSKNNKNNSSNSSSNNSNSNNSSSNNNINNKYWWRNLVILLILVW